MPKSISIYVSGWVASLKTWNKNTKNQNKWIIKVIKKYVRFTLKNLNIIAFRFSSSLFFFFFKSELGLSEAGFLLHFHFETIKLFLLNIVLTENQILFIYSLKFYTPQRSNKLKKNSKIVFIQSDWVIFLLLKWRMMTEEGRRLRSPNSLKKRWIF